MSKKARDFDRTFYVISNIKPYIMSRNGFTDAERAHCVICMTEGYGATAVQRKFHDEYSGTPPACSTVRLRRADNQQRGTNAHRGGNGRPQINVQTKNRI